MAAAVESGKAAVERFGSAGMALLPWTRQILGVLWEQLRLLVQVIYFSFMSVFQMFRLEVHLRITDESGQHVQHMTTTTSPTDSFLFSSLFDGESGVMVGGTNPLSNFCADVGDAFARSGTAEALLSSLRADELCCGLVGQDEGLFLGHHPSWKMGFGGDWNIFTPGDAAGSDQACHKSAEKAPRQDASEEERSSHWSSEEDQGLGEFDSEESKALWESLSKSNDPYNPFFFSACISTSANMGKRHQDSKESSDAECAPASKVPEELSGPGGLNFWVSRSDSESSWASSDGSCADLDKAESERLWELFSSPIDPYNPMFFTACTATRAPPAPRQEPQPAPRPAPLAKPDAPTEEKDGAPAALSSEDDEEEQLWKSLCQSDDPYHPLNFQACLQSSTTTGTSTPSSKLPPGGDPDTPPCESSPSPGEKLRERPVVPRSARAPRPLLPERQRKHHKHPETRRVPWKRLSKTPGSASTEEKRCSRASTTQKKVWFSPLVEVHVMRTWPFARQATRKGHWEELARDRDRFRRRIVETERAVGRCLAGPHRERLRAYLDAAAPAPEP